MVAPRGRAPGVLAIALLVVRVASRLVPASLRGDWRREWEGELWHRYRSVERLEDGSVGGKAALLLRSGGSLFDGLQLAVGDVDS